ncbi:MAG: DUF1569 domain-containing protein [Gemmatimonadota bacterium]
MRLIRSLLDPDVLMSEAAMARDLPRAWRLKPVDGNLFFTEGKRQEYRRRIADLRPESPRQWGTMEVDQMLHHLDLACGGSLGFYDVPDESDVLTRTVGKWTTVDWFQEQPVGLRLPRGFKIPRAQRFDFAHERAQLLTIVEAAWNARTDEAWKPHPLFGRMTVRQWGKLLQMHLDYHLRQFAA